VHCNLQISIEGVLISIRFHSRWCVDSNDRDCLPLDSHSFSLSLVILEFSGSHARRAFCKMGPIIKPTPWLPDLDASSVY